MGHNKDAIKQKTKEIFKKHILKRLGKNIIDYEYICLLTAKIFSPEIIVNLIRKALFTYTINSHQKGVKILMELGKKKSIFLSIYEIGLFYYWYKNKKKGIECIAAEEDSRTRRQCMEYLFSHAHEEEIKNLLLSYLLSKKKTVGVDCGANELLDMFGYMNI